MGKGIDRTLKNWRWWVSLPVLLPGAAIALSAIWAADATWWVGQKICDVSNAVRNVQSPNWLVSYFRWVRYGAPVKNQENTTNDR